MSDFNIVLYNPVIPQNTGSIARLCACTGAALHLIHPLGFQTDSASVKRAGLDYWDAVDIREYQNWEDFLEKNKPQNLYFFTKFAKKYFNEIKIETPCYLVMGSETQGLPQHIHENFSNALFKIPMRTQIVRSLNLSQAAAVAVYEAMRQNNFSTIENTETLTAQRLPSWIDTSHAPLDPTA